MARVTSDLRFALRQIMRSPGFAITAVLTLALAIGANTAIFTLLNQALMRALPVKDPSQLVVISYAGSREGHKESQGGDSPGHDHYFSYPMYQDLRANNKVFSGLGSRRVGKRRGFLERPRGASRGRNGQRQLFSDPWCSARSRAASFAQRRNH